MRFNGSHSEFAGGHTSLCFFYAPQFLRIYWADKWRPPSEVCTCTSALRRIWLPRLPASTDMACRRGDGSYPMWISLGKSCHVISWYHDISCDIWESSSGDDLIVLEWDWCNIKRCRETALPTGWLAVHAQHPETWDSSWAGVPFCVPAMVCHFVCPCPKELIIRMVQRKFTSPILPITSGFPRWRVCISCGAPPSCRSTATGASGFWPPSTEGRRASECWWMARSKRNGTSFPNQFGIIFHGNIIYKGEILPLPSLFHPSVLCHTRERNLGAIPLLFNTYSRMLMRKVATQSDQSVDCCPSVPFFPRPYGFCSLNNVNKASSKRDEMPSFFTAETLKCQPGPAGQIPKATHLSEPWHVLTRDITSFFMDDLIMCQIQGLSTATFEKKTRCEGRIFRRVQVPLSSLLLRLRSPVGSFRAEYRGWAPALDVGIHGSLE